jgi:hypothetical protein
MDVLALTSLLIGEQDDVTPKKNEEDSSLPGCSTLFDMVTKFSGAPQGMLVASADRDRAKMETPAPTINEGLSEFTPSRTSASTSSRQSTIEGRIGTPTVQLSVFLERVSETSLYSIPFAKDETLATLSTTFASFFRVPVEHQTITILASPQVLSYRIGRMSSSELASVRLNDGSSILLRQNSQSGANTGNTCAAWRAETSFQRSAPEDMQSKARERLTTVLSDKSRGVNLQDFSDLTGFSKASLSLWRRNIYKGNVQAIATSVEQALDQLERWQYSIPASYVSPFKKNSAASAAAKQADSSLRQSYTGLSSYSSPSKFLTPGASRMASSSPLLGMSRSPNSNHQLLSGSALTSSLTSSLLSSTLTSPPSSSLSSALSSLQPSSVRDMRRDFSSMQSSSLPQTLLDAAPAAKRRRLSPEVTTQASAAPGNTDSRDAQ